MLLPSAATYCLLTTACSPEHRSVVSERRLTYDDMIRETEQSPLSEREAAQHQRQLRGAERKTNPDTQGV